MTDKTFKIIIFAAIVLAVFGLYWPSLQNGFVYDDEQIVINNSQVASLKNIGKAFTSCIWEPQLQTCYKRTNHYRPLHTLSIMFTLSLSKGFAGAIEPFVFHLVNIIYYIIFCWLVFVLLTRLFKDKLPAILGTTIFLFHPLHTESVMWISGLPELLMGIFAIWTFLVHDSGRKKWLAGFLFFLALLSKETAIALIPVLLIYDYLFEDNSDAQTGRSPDLIERRGYLWYAAFFIIYLIMRVSAIGFSKKIPFDFGVSIWEKISAAVIGFGLYFKKIFLPWPLSPLIPIEPASSTANVEFVVGAILILLFVLAIVRSVRLKHKFWGLGLSIYTSFLIPPIVSMFMIFTKGDLIIADRYLSFPLLGVAMIFGYFVAFLFRKINKVGALCCSIALIVIFAIFGYQTFAQNKIWNSSQNLYEHIQLTNEKRGINSNQITFNLALIYEKNGETDRANKLYSKIISRAGDFPLSASQAANQLGLFYMKQNNFVVAESFFQKAVEIFPYNEVPRNNLDLLQNGIQ